MEQDDFLTLRLPVEIKRCLDVLSEETGISASAIARSFIAKAIGQQNEATRIVNLAVRRAMQNVNRQRKTMDSKALESTETIQYEAQQ